MRTSLACPSCSARTEWRRQGAWEEVGAGQFQYLRGTSEGGLAVRIDGLEVWVLPDGVATATRRNRDARAVLVQVAALLPVQGDVHDCRMALFIGGLFTSGHRNIVYPAPVEGSITVGASW